MYRSAPRKAKNVPGLASPVRYQRVAPRKLSLALYSAFAGGVAGFVLPASLAWANPQGEQVVRGNATFVTNGSTLTVTNTPGAAVNWQSFSIKANETTHFQQANSASSVLNRVVSKNPSELLGNLTSNGKVVLVNPFGITVGRGAAVDTAGFTASTLNITDADWANGKLRFKGNSLSGDVKVDGVIRSQNGDVMLFAPNVTVGSDALVKADNGNVIIGAGQKVEVTGRGLEGIRFEIQSEGNKAVNLGTLQGNAVGIFAGTLRHSGSITAQTATMEGGKVVLRAVKDVEVSAGAKVIADGAAGKAGGQISISSAAGDVLVGAGARITANGGPADAAGTGAAGGAGGTVAISADVGKLTVAPGAKISADGAQGGSVRLFGETEVRVAGALSAVSPATAVRADSSTQIEPVSVGGTSLPAVGGKVEVLGKQVWLDTGAGVDVSGDAGGGTILIGGDFQGKNAAVPNALNTNVAPGVHLTADGRAEGNGGKIIVWADNDTYFAGTLSARGGEQGGNGGFAETSGKNALYFRGRVDLGARRGRVGDWLLDPDFIVIAGGSGNGSDTDLSTLSLAGGTGTVMAGDSPSPFTIYESEIEGTNANIFLQANKKISLSGSFVNNDLAAQAGKSITLEVTSALSTSDGIDLTSSSDGSGFVLRTSGAGTITLNTVSSNSFGNVKLASLETAGGVITVNAQGAVTLANTLASSGGIVTVSGTSITTLSSIHNGGINAGAGTIYLTASDSNGVSIGYQGTLTAGNASIVADRLVIDTSAGTIDVANSLNIFAYSAGRQIRLGGDDTTATSFLGVAQDELARITSSLIRVGSVSNTGDIVINTAISRAGKLLTLRTGGTVIQNVVAGEGITAAGLAAVGAYVYLGGDNIVGTFAGQASQTLNYNSLNSFNIGAVDVASISSAGSDPNSITFSTTNTGQTVTLLTDVITTGASIYFNASRTRVAAPLININSNSDGAGTSGAVVFMGELGADVAGRQLHVSTAVTSTSDPYAYSGPITFNGAGNAGGTSAYLKSLSVDASNVNGGFGLVQLNGDMLLGANGVAGIGGQATAYIAGAELRANVNSAINTNAGAVTGTFGGLIDLSNATTLSAGASHAGLTLLANGAFDGDGGTISIGNTWSSGNLLGYFTASATAAGSGGLGQVVLNGSIRTTTGTTGAPSSGNITLDGNIIAVGNAMLATGFDTAATNAGNVIIGSSGLGSISANAPGATLTINTSPSDPDGLAGNVRLPKVGNAAGYYLNQLDVDATSTGAYPGTISLFDDVKVDHGASVSTPGYVRLAGGYLEMRKGAGTTQVIDTLQDAGAGSGGDIDISVIGISTSSSTAVVKLDTSTTDESGGSHAGRVYLNAAVGPMGGQTTFVPTELQIKAEGYDASGDGDIHLYGNIGVQDGGTIGISGNVLLHADTRLGADSGTGNANIALRGTFDSYLLNARRDLTLDAGANDIDLQNVSLGGSNLLKSVSIAGGHLFLEAIHANGGVNAQAAGKIMVLGEISARGGNIVLVANGGSVDVAANVNSIGGDGAETDGDPGGNIDITSATADVIVRSGVTIVSQGGQGNNEYMAGVLALNGGNAGTISISAGGSIVLEDSATVYSAGGTGGYAYGTATLGDNGSSGGHGGDGGAVTLTAGIVLGTGSLGIGNGALVKSRGGDGGFGADGVQGASGTDGASGSAGQAGSDGGFGGSGGYGGNGGAVSLVAPSMTISGIVESSGGLGGASGWGGNGGAGGGGWTDGTIGSAAGNGGNGGYAGFAGDGGGGGAVSINVGDGGLTILTGASLKSIGAAGGVQGGEGAGGAAGQDYGFGVGTAGSSPGGAYSTPTPGSGNTIDIQSNTGGAVTIEGASLYGGAITISLANGPADLTMTGAYLSAENSVSIGVEGGSILMDAGSSIDVADGDGHNITLNALGGITLGVLNAQAMYLSAPTITSASGVAGANLNGVEAWLGYGGIQGDYGVDQDDTIKVNLTGNLNVQALRSAFISSDNDLYLGEVRLTAPDGDGAIHIHSGASITLDGSISNNGVTADLSLLAAGSISIDSSGSVYMSYISNATLSSLTGGVYIGSTVQSESGSISILSGDGITIANDGGRLYSNDGNISLEAAGVVHHGYIYSGASAEGVAVSIVTDNLFLDGNVQTAPDATVLIAARTPGKIIDVALASDLGIDGAFKLSVEQLSNIETGVLQLGASRFGGDVNFRANFAPESIATLAVYGANITQTGGSIAVDALAAVASTMVSLTDPGNTFNAVAGTAGTGGFSVGATPGSGTLSAGGTVAGQSGIATDGGGNVSLVSGGALNLSGGVTAAGNAHLEAADALTQDTGAIISAQSLHVQGGSVSLTESNSITTGVVDGASTAGGFAFTNSGIIRIGALNISANDLVTPANGSVALVSQTSDILNAGTGRSISATGAVSLSGIDGVGEANDNGRIEVNAGGRVNATTDTGDVWLTGSAILLGTVSTGANTSTVDVLSTTGMTVAGTSTGNDNWFLKSSNNLVFASGAQIQADTVTLTSTGGNITSTPGDIVVDVPGVLKLNGQAIGASGSPFSFRAGQVNATTTVGGIFLATDVGISTSNITTSTPAGAQTVDIRSLGVITVNSDIGGQDLLTLGSASGVLFDNTGTISAGQIINIDSDATSQGNVKFFSPVTATGYWSIDSGTTTFAAASTTSTFGNVYVGDGAKLDIAAGTASVANLSSGFAEGTVATSGGTLSLGSGSSSALSNVQMNTGRLILGNDLSIHDLSIHGGTVAGTGTLSISAGGTALLADYATVNVPFVSNGPVNIDGYGATLSAGGSFNGIGMTLASGSGVQFDGGTFKFIDTTVEGNGATFSMTGNTTVLFTGSSSLNAVLLGITANPGNATTLTLNNTGGNYVDSLYMSGAGATLNGSEDITITGNFAWSGGTMSGEGTTYNQAGSGGDFYIHTDAALALNRTLQNEGFLEISGPGAITLSSTGVLLNVGTMTLRPSGTTIVVGDSGASLRNFGTLNFDGSNVPTTQRSEVGVSLENASGALLAIKDGKLNLTGILLDNEGTIALGDRANGTVGELQTDARNYTNNGTITGFGTINVNSGTLTNAGSIMPGDGTAPGGTLTVAGNFRQESTGTLSINVYDASASDVLRVTGDAALGGTLSIGGPNYAMAQGDSYTPLVAASLSGTFTVTSDQSGSGVTLTPGYNATSVTISASFAPTAPNEWTGASNDDWNTAGNWSLGHVPTNGETVIIDPVGAHTINLAGVTVNSLGAFNFTGTDDTLVLATGGYLLLPSSSSLLGTLSFSGGVLVNNNTAQSANRIAISSGQLINGGTLTAGSVSLGGGTLSSASGVVNVTGAFDWTGGMLLNGTLNTAGASTLTGSAVHQIYAAFWNNSGAVTHSGAGAVELQGGVVIANLAGGTWTETGTAAKLFANGATAGNNYFTNAGTVSWQSPGSQMVGDLKEFNNAGTVNVVAGALMDLGNSGSDTGLWTVDGTLRLSGGTRALNAGNLAGPGTLQIRGGTLSVYGSASFGIAGTGSVNIDQGELGLSQAGTLSFANAVAVSQGLLSSSGDVQFASLTLVNAATLGGNGKKAVSGAFNFADSTVQNGSLVTNGGALLYGAAQTLSNATWTNNSVVSQTAGALTLNSATLDNASGGSYTVSGSGAVAIAGTGNGSRIANAGAIYWNTSASRSVGVNVANTGSIDVLAGTMNIGGGTFTQSGTVDVASGATLQRNAGFTNAGTITGSGTIGTGGSKLFNTGTLSPGGSGQTGVLVINGALDMNGGTVLAELSGTGNYDQVSVLGNVVTGGTVKLVETTPFIGGNDSFDVVTFSGTATGTSPTLSYAISGVTLGQAAATGAVRVKATSVTNNWAFDVDGSWTDAAKWSRGHAPTVYEAAYINPASMRTVTLSGPTQTPLSLQMPGDDMLTVNGGTLQLAAASAIGSAATLSLISGSIGGAGSLDIAGTFNWSGGSLDSTGTLGTTGAVLINGGSKNLNTTWNVGNGSVVNYAAANLLIGAGAGLNIGNGGTFNIVTADSIASDIRGAGTFSSAAGSVVNMNSPQGSNSIYTSAVNLAGTTNLMTGEWDFDREGAGTAFNISGAVNMANGTRIKGYSTLGGPQAVFNLNAGASFNVASGTAVLDMNDWNLNVNTPISLPAGLVLSQSAGTLNAGSNLGVAAAYNLSGGVLTGTGNVSVTGNFNWSGGTVTGTGTLATSGATDLGGSAAILDGRTWANSGVATWQNGETLTLRNAAVIRNLATGELVVGNTTGAGIAAGVGGGNIVNGGLFTMSGTVATGGGNFSNNATLQGSGLIDLGSGTLSSNGGIQPGGTGAAGTIHVIGNVDLTGGTVYSELFSSTSYDKLAVTGNLKSGGTLAFSEMGTPFVTTADAFDLVSWTGGFSGTLPTLSGSIAGATMTLVNTGGALRLSASSILNSWLSTHLSGDWDTGSNWSRGHAPTAGESISVDAGGAFTVTVASGTSGLAALTLGSDDTFLLTGGNFMLPGTASLSGTVSLAGGTLTNSGGTYNFAALNWQSGFIGGSGSISTSALGLAGAGPRSLTGSTLTAVGGTTLAGGLELLGGLLDWTGGSLAVTGGASLDINGGSLGSGAFLNQGSVHIGSLAAAYTTLNATAAQTGSFAIDAGHTLSLGSGTVTLASGAALTGGVWDVAAGLITVAGTLDRGAGALTRVSGGTLAVPGSLSTASLAITGGTLNGAGDLTVTDTFIQGAGALGTGFNRLSITQQSGDLAVGVLGATSVTLAATNGAITDANAGALNVTAGNVKLTARDGIDIDLSTASLNAATTGAGLADISNAGALDVASLSIMGDVRLSTAGALTQSGAVQVVGATTLSTAGAGVTLGNGANTFGGTVTLQGTGATQLLDSGPLLAVGGSAASLTLDAQNVSLASLMVSGPLTISVTGLIGQTAAINVTGLTRLTAGSIALPTANTASTVSTFGGGVSFNATGDVTLAANGALLLGGTGNHAGGNMSLTATGPVSQTSALTVGGALASVSAAGQSISFGGFNNDFNAFSFNAASVQLNDVNSVAIGGTASGNVRVASVGGVSSYGSIDAGSLDVTLSGAGGSATISQASVSGAARFAVSGTGSYQSISFSNLSATGTLAGPLAATGAIDLAFKNTGLALPQVQAGDLFVSAGGAVTQTGPLVAGTTHINSAGYGATLANAGNHLGTLTLDAATAVVTDAGTMLQLGGNITGALQVNAQALGQSTTQTLNTGSANLSASSGIALVGVNRLGTLAASSGGAITVNDVGSALTLANITTPGSLAIQSGGVVVGGGTLSSASLDLVALAIGSNAQPLEFSAPVARLYGVSGDVYARSSQSLTLAGLGAAGNASVSSTQGLTVVGEAEAGGALALAGTGVTVNGAVSAGSVVIDARTGTLAVGGGSAPASVFGESSVALLGRDIVLLGGAAQGASAKVDSEGSISVNAAGNFVIRGGSGAGALAEVSGFGAGTIAVGGAMEIVGGSGTGASAQLEGGPHALLQVTAPAVTLQGGTGPGTRAAIVSEGDITVVGTGVTLAAGTGSDADAVVISYFGKVTLPSCSGCVKLNTPPFGNEKADVGVLGGEEYLTILTGSTLATTELLQLQTLLSALTGPAEPTGKPKRKDDGVVIEAEVCK